VPDFEIIFLKNVSSDFLQIFAADRGMASYYNAPYLRPEFPTVLENSWDKLEK
jgi:hypothetical protein